MVLFIFNFNSRYPYYIARTALATIDHNFHFSRPHRTTKDGNQMYVRKYSKRTKRWHAEPLKEEKRYPYLQNLQSCVLKMRQEDKNSSSRKTSRKECDPKNIAPTIDFHRKPPATSEVVGQRLSRFVKK